MTIGYETYPDYCPTCHVSGELTSCVDLQTGRPVPDHDDRPTTAVAELTDNERDARE